MYFLRGRSYQGIPCSENDVFNNAAHSNFLKLAMRRFAKISSVLSTRSEKSRCSAMCNDGMMLQLRFSRMLSGQRPPLNIRNGRTRTRPSLKRIRLLEAVLEKRFHKPIIALVLTGSVTERFGSSGRFSRFDQSERLVAFIRSAIQCATGTVTALPNVRYLEPSKPGGSHADVRIPVESDAGESADIAVIGCLMIWFPTAW